MILKCMTMENNDLNSVGSRLKYYIEKVLGKTIADYTASIGLPPRSNTISNYTKNKYPISPDMLKRMKTYKNGFPTVWILEGKGDIPEMDIEPETDKKDILIAEQKDRIAFLEKLVMHLMDEKDVKRKKDGIM